MEGIDRDRGCTIRFHPSGFRVVMYKDAPGEYLDERGEPLSDKLAAQAGFDVEDLARERRKQLRLAEYKARVEEEFATEQQDVERLLSSDDSELAVKHIGKGRYAIMDSQGQRMTQKPLTKTEAEDLMKDLVSGSGGDDNGTPS